MQVQLRLNISKFYDSFPEENSSHVIDVDRPACESLRCVHLIPVRSFSCLPPPSLCVSRCAKDMWGLLCFFAAVAASDLLLFASLRKAVSPRGVMRFVPSFGLSFTDSPVVC